MGHGDHRGDADAATDEDRAAGVRGQGEQVARCADGHFATFLEQFVDGHRATTGLRIAQHAETVDGGVGRVTAEGILAHQAGFQVDIHMGAGFERRQVLARRVGEVEDHHALALLHPLADHQIQYLLTHTGLPAPSKVLIVLDRCYLPHCTHDIIWNRLIQGLAS
ncbi:hypothetical protein D3C78_1514140 [compost metagenome]